MKKISLFILSAIALYIIVLLTYPIISYKYYNFKEYWSDRNSIEWSKTKKIAWRDFQCDCEKTETNHYADIAFSTRYNIEEPILFRSKTLFMKKSSFVCDTTDAYDLRVVQAKFDLLEIYRRKMSKEVDSLSKNNKSKLTLDYFKSLNKRYYTLFENEYGKYANRPDKSKSFAELENRIKAELE
jgi:hypothetical protein